MPLPSSPNPIKASKIKEEFGTIDSPKIRIGQYRDATTHGGKQWPFDVGIPIGTGSDDTTTPIRFSDFHGKQLNTITVIDGGDTEYRVIASEEDKEVIGGLKSNSGKGVRARARNIIYIVNKTIGSARGSRNKCALRTGTSNDWYGTNDQESPKINIELGEGAKLYGAGGEGGKGGDADGGSGENGEDGTSALGLEVPTESIVVRSGAKIVAGGGGGGGGGGAKNSKAKVSGGAGGGGAGLPGANGGSAGNTSSAGSILTFEMRSSAAFVNQSTRELVPDGVGGGTEEEDTGDWFAGDLVEEETVSGTAYRSGEEGNAPPFGWTSLADTPVVETVNMIHRDSGNGTGFRVTIRYSPWQKDADLGTARFQTKIEIVEVLSRGQKYSNGDTLTTALWNSGEGNAQRIIRVTSVSTRAKGGDANDGNLEEGGDGGDGAGADTGGETNPGGVSGGGGGGGASVIPGQSGEGGQAGDKQGDGDQNDGQDGDYEEGGGSGGGGDAEGEDQREGSGGSGGENGYAITSSVGSIPAVSGSSRVYGDQASSGGVS